MLSFPKSTECDVRIPKKKFYENTKITPTLKKIFVSQIDTIHWCNKISSDTMNIAEGDIVKEIEVFEIKLKEQITIEPVLLQIDREIPYHIIFVIEYNDKYQLWIAYKEPSQSANAFKVLNYYHTDWINSKELTLTIEGLSIDRIYENFIRQIGKEELTAFVDKPIQLAVENDQRRKVLKKQIDALQAKVRKEKQFNKQVELNTELKILKQELEDLCNGKNENGNS